MVNPNRWSWSGGLRKVQVQDVAVTGQRPLVRSPDKPELCEVDKPNDQKLPPGSTTVSSRRLSRNRWSWRPDAIISVTLEDQQENEQGEMQAQNKSLADKPAKSFRRLSKNVKTTEAASAATTTATIPSSSPSSPPPARSRPRPSSMIAPASASFGGSPSYSTYKPPVQQQPQQQQADEELSSPGVKNAFNRILNRRLSLYQSNNTSMPVQHQHQQAQPEPTPPPSRQQQHPPRPMPMQPPMRQRLQLHNPQNTLRATSAPVANVQNQGHIENGRIVAPLPGLDENSQLQLPSATSRPATAIGTTGAAAAQGLGTGTTSSSAAAAPPSVEETGLLGRLIRRRLVPKQKDAENHKRRGISTSTGDNTSHPSGADDQVRSSPDPVPTISETTEQHQMQAQALPLNPSSHKTHDTSSSTPRSETVSDARTSSKSSVPRFLRQVTKPRQAPATMTQTAGAAILHKSKSHSHLKTPQQPASPSTAQARVRSKPSFGKRFWSRPGANDFGEDDDHVITAEAPARSSAPRTVYVPKHAAADFSRTTHNRHSFILGNGLENALRPLGTTTAAAQGDESEPHQRQRTPSAEKAEKRFPRDLSSSKYEAPSPLELHRRLEILKSKEVEVVTTREPATTDPWQHQLDLLRNTSNTSSSNGKAPAPRSHSRPRSCRRHSFNLVSDPYARELTPPKSASPVEMEAPFDPPSRTPQPMTPAAAPPRPTSSQARPPSRQDAQTKQPAIREMTDYERFLADAEAAEREHQAQMWRNLARRSGHYGYSDNPWSSVRPVDPYLAGAGGALNTAANRGNKRNSAQYTVGKRASMMSFAAAGDERRLTAADFYGQPTAAHDSGVDEDGKMGLRHQGSVSKRISNYIKPPKPSSQPAYEDWPTGRANRRSVIAGVSEE
ncbi:uncharacterized protein ColSpa_12141 [Colletotrichum spaethianum]|uniref:Uncharacterized protein n=1 Tax=Colletotrichum spaethianum TaxID=700344 RepID=A0AA37UQ82_9PEZI|nr:uncharacterized protein ColSpa_12141 [Colletotrichum spaethianum]GKT51960.1 hypothetical protein ColSpa_12141 [Colletotrichum spaethianum]